MATFAYEFKRKEKSINRPIRVKLPHGESAKINQLAAFNFYIRFFSCLFNYTYQ